MPLLHHYPTKCVYQTEVRISSLQQCYLLPSIVPHDKINYCHHQRHRFLVICGELFTRMAVEMDASALPPAAVICHLILRAENTSK